MRRLCLPILVLSCAPTVAYSQIMRGKVVMEDGSAPPQRALIERLCVGGYPNQETVAGKKGEFFWRVPDEGGVKVGSATVTVPCYLRARLKDWESEQLDIRDPRVLRNLQLPTFVLRRAKRDDGPRLPEQTLKSWQSATSAYDGGRWEEAERLSREVLKTQPQFSAAWMIAGGAAFNLQKLPEAREALQRAVALDAKSLGARLQLLRVEIAMERWGDAVRTADGLIEADIPHRYPEGYLDRGIAHYMLANTPGARDDWKQFLELAPASPKAAIVTAKLEELNRGARPAPSAGDLLAPAAEPEFQAGIEAWVPGGIQALAAVVRLPSTPAPAVFFREYCHAIAFQTSRWNERPIPGFAATLTAYLTSVAGLTALGQPKGDVVEVAFSLSDPKAVRILALLGWRLRDKAIEPGEEPVDGLRQQVPRALGIDVFAMQEALQRGETFRFSIATGAALVVGGRAWNAALEAFPALDGGIAEAFARDPRLARVYAGLGSMPNETAVGLVKAAGLRSLVQTHSEILWQYGAAMAGPIPGGPEAEPVWTKLAGASPRDAVKFTEALLHGHSPMAAFYAAVSSADPARQRFVTKDAVRAGRIYQWFQGGEATARRRALAALPIDETGRVHFPGGAAAWPASNEEFSPSLDLDTLIAVADLERGRGVPFDAEAARALERNTQAWRPLFPYFAAFPKLTGADFAALENVRPDGAWLAAAELIALGRRAGSLDDDAAARAFGQLCRSADALVVVREIAGGGADLDDVVATRLLRLTGDRRAAFDRVRELQNAPRLTGARGGDVVPALTGVVYGALLDPSLLILHEDRGLLRRHDFGDRFAPATFAGTRFRGGFTGMTEAAAKLARIGADEAPGAAASEATFRVSARLVEINTTVTDDRGALVDGLQKSQFSVLDNGARQTVAAFENEASSLSCALLLDTSESMERALGALKSSAMGLASGLRQADSIAVYSLTGGVTELQPFTTDKQSARRAIWGAEVGELTALHDGLVRVNRDLAARTGKKAIVVFTDGEDTASALDADTAILRAKRAGVPIYTIAQGNAVRRPDLLRKLSQISDSTGGLSFSIRSTSEIRSTFDKVLQDLLHGYLLEFSPSASGSDWRKLEVRLNAPAKGKVRAREGYYPD
jgi:VWFA-related protein